MAFYLAYLLAFYLASLLAFYLAVEVQRCTLSWAGPRLRSSGAHWAGKVPGWGPAVHTELGRSQVEVQRCTLSWEGPRLRSSGAHWAGTVPGWGPAVHTELGRSQVEVQRCTLTCEVGKELGEESWQRAWRRVGKAEVQVEVDADMVEEKLEEEDEVGKKKEKKKKGDEDRAAKRKQLVQQVFTVTAYWPWPYRKVVPPPAKQRQVLCMSLQLDSRPLHRRGQGAKRRDCPKGIQGRWMCTLLVPVEAGERSRR